MSIKTAYSKKALADAVNDVRTQCSSVKPRAVVYFASAAYDPDDLAKRMHSAFPEACVVGCSTAGEIADTRMMTESMVAMSLDEAVVDKAAAVVIENVKTKIELKEAFAALEKKFEAPISSLELKQHVGMILVDGLSGAEEQLMERIGDRTDLFFVGGSAGDDLKFRRTNVAANGRAYTDAAVLLLMRVKAGFEIIKTQSFKASGKNLVATKVDEAHRTVLEFDGKPAAEAYAAALGVPCDKVADQFMSHPLGLMIAGEPFVRSPQRVENQGMVFYCNVKHGMTLNVLEATDIVADTRKALEARKSAVKHIAGIIDFHCILRALELRSEKRCDEYASIFSGIPTIGFNTYGEEYLGHINQTSTMLVFK